jgi:hypothetical protein
VLLDRRGARLLVHADAGRLVALHVELARLLRDGADRAAPRAEEILHEVAIDAVFLTDLAANHHQAARAAAPHRDEVAEAALVALNGRLLLRQLAHTADPRQQAPVRDE